MVDVSESYHHIYISLRKSRLLFCLDNSILTNELIQHGFTYCELRDGANLVWLAWFLSVDKNSREKKLYTKMLYNKTFHLLTQWFEKFDLIFPEILSDHPELMSKLEYRF